MPAPTRKPPVPAPSTRLTIASRSLAAIGGGYLAANLFVPAFVRVTPMARADAVQAGVMLGFVIFALAAIWAFACRTAALAWAGILAVALLCGLVAFALPGGGA